MNRWVLRGLRFVIVGGLAGSVFVQTVMLFLLYRDMDGADQEVLDIRPPLFAILVLLILVVQVCAVCVWRLLTMVQRRTVFSRPAFRFVDVIIGAIGFASLLLFVLGCFLAPGDLVAPGLVLLIGGASATIAGIALIVLVLRALLAQAVARDLEATHLQSELDEVI